MITFILRNEAFHKGIHLDNHFVYDRSFCTVADGISMTVARAITDIEHPDRQDQALVDGLAFVAGYLFIPFGEEGLNYAKEKIAPAAMEDFLRDRADYLFEQTGVFKYPEYAQLVSLTYDYCKNFSQHVLPFDYVSAVLLAVRLESERLKTPPISLSYRTPASQKDAWEKYYRFRCDYFTQLRVDRPKYLDLDYHLAQLIKEDPFRGEFQLTDEHRQTIDDLPIFTSLWGRERVWRKRKKVIQDL